MKKHSRIAPGPRLVVDSNLCTSLAKPLPYPPQCWCHDPGFEPVAFLWPWDGSTLNDLECLHAKSYKTWSYTYKGVTGFCCSISSKLVYAWLILLPHACRIFLQFKNCMKFEAPRLGKSLAWPAVGGRTSPVLRTKHGIILANLRAGCG